MSLKQDVDRGLEITAEMDRLKKELKGITERLEAAALRGKQVPLEDPERDGTQFLAEGSSRIVPVIITADYLAATVTEGSEKHLAMLQAAGARFGDLYKPKTIHERVYDDGKVFRREARLILGPEIAEPFIAACVVRDKHGIAKNALKVEWARNKGMEVAA